MSPSIAGLPPEIVGPYLVKIVTPGALAAASTATALSPDALRDVVLRVGYRLATPGA
jgi:hypothetical protein